MSDLLREVDDAIRADKMKRLWDEHKTAIIAGVSALIIGTAVFSGWNAWENHNNKVGTSRILSALEAPNITEALHDAAKDNKGNSKVIALLNAATLELRSGKKEAALASYNDARKTGGADTTLKDLATVQAISLTLDLQPDAKADDLLKALSPVAKNKKSPWQAEAIFMSAFVKGEKNQDYASASKDLQDLADRNDVSNSLQQRASALQSVYDLKTAEKK